MVGRYAGARELEPVAERLIRVVSEVRVRRCHCYRWDGLGVRRLRGPHGWYVGSSCRWAHAWGRWLHPAPMPRTAVGGVTVPVWPVLAWPVSDPPVRATAMPVCPAVGLAVLAGRLLAAPVPVLPGPLSGVVGRLPATSVLLALLGCGRSRLDRCRLLCRRRLRRRRLGLGWRRLCRCCLGLAWRLACGLQGGWRWSGLGDVLGRWVLGQERGPLLGVGPWRGPDRLSLGSRLGRKPQRS